MARIKATAAWWVQPGTRSNSRGQPRRSPRLRKGEATLEQTFPTNPQSASILFRVPPEIRDYIFKLALATYEDSTRPCNVVVQEPGCYQKHFPHHRPGHYHHLRTDTALLRTCRLIHNETAILPISINTHTLCYPDMVVLCFPVSNIATSYFKRMTPRQLAAVQHLHIFCNYARLKARVVGQYISYGVFAELGLLREKKIGDRGDERRIEGPYPKTLTITIRECDWTFRNHTVFDLGGMLDNDHWENVLGGLKELRMELEVQYKNKEVLVPVMNKLKEFSFDIGGGEALVTEGIFKEDRWTGPIRRRLDDPLGFKWEETEYYVASAIWKSRSIDQGSAD